ncbi:hypothetical protein F5X97DRAFT_298153 [Nemania serpens]|nr:hypothetical protein F5X97DRAFT_298153 [Nemania serpens]
MCMKRLMRKRHEGMLGHDASRLMKSWRLELSASERASKGLRHSEMNDKGGAGRMNIATTITASAKLDKKSFFFFFFFFSFRRVLLVCEFGRFIFSRHYISGKGKHTLLAFGGQVKASRRTIYKYLYIHAVLVFLSIELCFLLGE